MKENILSGCDHITAIKDPSDGNHIFVSLICTVLTYSDTNRQKKAGDIKMSSRGKLIGP